MEPRRRVRAFLTGLLAGSLDHGRRCPCGVAAGDEVYGAHGAPRKALAGHELDFVPAVAKSHRFTTGVGARAR